MAIQSSTGSVSPTSTSTGTNTDNGPKPLNPSSSIPFSFLIAFIALFLFFLGCGLGTRRVAWALRRGFGLDDLDNDGGHRKKRRELRKPEIWDVWPEELKAEGKWDCVRPLSAKLLFVSSKVDTSTSPSNPIPQPTSPTISPTLISPEPSLGYFPGRIGRISAPVPPPPHNALPTIREIRERVERARPSGRTPSHANWTRQTQTAAPTTANANTPHQLPTPTQQPSPREPLLIRIRAYLLSSPYVLALLIEMGVHPRHLGLIPPADEEEEESGEVEGMQVSVVIKMPDPNHLGTCGIGGKRISGISMSSGESKEGKGKQRLSIVKEPLGSEEGMGDYVIGIVEMPWNVPWKDLAPDDSDSKTGEGVMKGS
ncbi:hypothetical protein QCA50_020219 [Cerrena zonata]|uniref:Uncharacterized protein n=1 Tax=Cerrena zonata TaxID=2478898 RepID=A0AAW0F9E3_9APHY